jgi:hypothetical protein
VWKDGICQHRKFFETHVRKRIACSQAMVAHVLTFEVLVAAVWLICVPHLTVFFAVYGDHVCVCICVCVPHLTAFIAVYGDHVCVRA